MVSGVFLRWWKWPRRPSESDRQSPASPKRVETSRCGTNSASSAWCWSQSSESPHGAEAVGPSPSRRLQRIPSISLRTAERKLNFPRVPSPLCLWRSLRVTGVAPRLSVQRFADHKRRSRNPRWNEIPSFFSRYPPTTTTTKKNK